MPLLRRGLTCVPSYFSLQSFFTLMEIYFQLIAYAEGVRNTCRELASECFLGCGSETMELDPCRGDLRLVEFSASKATYVIDIKPFREYGSPRTIPYLASLRDLLCNPE